MRKTILILFCFFILTSTASADVDFNAVDEILSCGSGASLDDMDISSGMTISLWINLDSLGEATDNGAFISKGSEGDSGFWLLSATDTGTLRFDFTKDCATTDLRRVSADNSISLSAYRHVLMTWDGTVDTTGVLFYVDGTQTSYGTSTTGVGAINSDAALSVAIGNQIDLTNASDGRLSEVAVWDVILNATEIAQLSKSRVKNMPLQVRPASLMGYWPLQECASGSTCSSTFIDYSGNGNTCTPSNSPTGLGGIITQP